MSYLAIYRRFRPTDFSHVVGQEHVVTTLINQIKTERIGHAYLFCGARGTGKTTVARIFARAINCTNSVDGSPCGQCEVCQKLNNPSNLDIIEMDAASNNKVDNVQEIRANVQYPPVAGRYKVYIIDEVHMLTTEAFNALLKTLEEPPKHAVFILATTEPHKLPATILSRCMRFDFHLVSDKVIENLIENIYKEVGKDYEKEAINLIAKSGEGSIRDALSLADLCISYSDEKLTYKQVIDILGASDTTKTATLLQGILNNDVGGVLASIDELASLGKSISVLTKDVLAMVRDVLIVKTCKGAKEILALPESEYQKLSKLATLGDNHRFLRVLEIFTSIESDLRYSTHPRIVFEAASVKATLPQEDLNIDALISRVTVLENTVLNLMKNGVKVENAQNNVVENRQEDLAENSQKSAYKPENAQVLQAESVKLEEKPQEKTSENVVKKNIDVPKKKDENYLVKSVENVAQENVEPTEKRLSGFDYVPDEELPPLEDLTPPENQIGFDTFELSYGNVVMNDGSKVITEEPKKKVEPAVIRDRVPDSRLWGMIIKKLRSDKHIMLWIACQELDAKIENNKLIIMAEGENEYNLLIKKESIDVLQSILSSFAPYTLKIEGNVKNEQDSFNEDIEKVKKLFDGKIIVK